jgi:hypothetical protein
MTSVVRTHSAGYSRSARLGSPTRVSSTRGRPASADASSARRMNQRAHRKGLKALPDRRITSFFVDKSYRGKGVASLGLAGALREIARLGGGTGEKLSGRHGRRVDLGGLPAQRDGLDVRAARLHAHAPAWEEAVGSHVWMAPGTQGLSERDGKDEVARGHVSGPVCAAPCPLALMESADRGLISLPGSRSHQTLQFET